MHTSNNDNIESRIINIDDENFPLFSMKRESITGIVAEELFYKGHWSDEDIKVICDIYNDKYKYKYIIGFSDFRAIENRISSYKQLKLWGRVGLNKDLADQIADEEADVNGEGILYRGICRLRLIDISIADIISSSKNFLLLGSDNALNCDAIKLVSSTLEENINNFTRKLKCDVITLFSDDGMREFGGITYRFHG